MKNGQRYDIPLGVDVPNVNLGMSGNAVLLQVSESINDFPLGVDVPNVPIKVSDGNINLGVSESINIIDGQAYEGEYTFTPTQEAQTIPMFQLLNFRRQAAVRPLSRM